MVTSIGISRAMVNSLCLICAAASIAGCAHPDLGHSLVSSEPTESIKAACDWSNTVRRGPPKDGMPVRLEVMNRFGPFMGSEVITISDMNGMPLISLECGGPLAYFEVAPGIYHVIATLGTRKSNTAIADVRAQGLQIMLTLQPDPHESFDSPDVVP